jgi:hypothetical protein
MSAILGKIGDIEFQWNPPDMEESNTPKYVTRSTGTSVSPKDYTGNDGSQYNLTIFFAKGTFDGVEFYDIEDKIEGVRKLTKEDPETKSPPMVFLSYGSNYGWVICKSYRIIHKKKTQQNHTIYAEIELTLEDQFTEGDKTRTKREEKGDRVYLTGTDDTFRKIAFTQLKNADLWVAIADANPSVIVKMAGMILPPYVEITIPTWEDVQDYTKTDIPGLVRFL